MFLALFSAIFDEIKEEHKSSFNENDIRDFIDAFLKEMKRDNQDEAGFSVSAHRPIHPIISERMRAVELLALTRLFPEELSSHYMFFDFLTTEMLTK